MTQGDPLVRTCAARTAGTLCCLLGSCACGRLHAHAVLLLPHHARRIQQPVTVGRKAAICS